LMHGKNKPNGMVMVPPARGFTLIELVIAIAIISIMMAAIMPFFRAQPGAARKQFAAQLNGIVQCAWQQAIITRAVHRVLFNIKERRAWVERHTSPAGNLQKLEFEAVRLPQAQMQWPAALIIKQFFIEGFDEIARFAGRVTETIWFYVVADGMTQQVTINGVDKEDTLMGKPRPFGLVLNPFLAHFKEYDTYQK
jgi:prepilin-type N-terminal cleavage/methylation domain-containing protein